MRRKPMLGMLALVAAFVAVSALWLVRPGMDAPSENAVVLHVEQDCDSARQACLARGDDLEIELRLGPQLRPLEPFSAQLRALRGDLNAQARIDVKFQMRGMDMGLNRYRLGRDADGDWRARAVLPVCTTGRSDWYAMVEIVQDGRRWVAEMPFAVGQP
jgi:hypothetical protein